MAETLQVSLGKPGWIDLPRRSRERLRLVPGMTLRVEAGSDGGISLRVLPEPSPRVEENGWLGHTGEPAGDLGRAVERDREHRRAVLLERTGL